MAEIYVPGAIDIMGSANQMMQFRNSQQAQQANALQMQYAAEDRARAAQERSAAAGAASADRARKRELLEIYGNYGATPAPGGTGAPYDPYATLQNKLLTKGFASEAGNIAELQTKNLLGKKAAAETAGQEATTKGINIKNIDTRLSYFKRFASSVTTADSAANFARMMAEEFPEFAELYGSPKDAAERSAALFNTDPDAWQRHSVDLNAADLVKSTVDAKAAKAPKPVELDIGGRKIFVDMNPDSPTFKQEVTGFDKTLTPNEVATNTAAAAKADWEQKNPGFTIVDTASGKVKVNNITGVVEPLTLDGQTLMPSVKPGVTVNTGEKASEKTLGEAGSAIIKNAQAIQNYPSSIASLREVKKLIPSAKDMLGGGAETLNNTVNFLNNRLGTNINVKGLTAAAEIKSRLFEGVIARLKQMDSQPSQIQQAALAEALGTIDTDPDALAKVIDVWIDEMQNKVKTHNAQVDKVVKSGNAPAGDWKVDLPEPDAPALVPTVSNWK